MSSAVRIKLYIWIWKIKNWLSFFHWLAQMSSHSLSCVFSEWKMIFYNNQQMWNWSSIFLRMQFKYHVNHLPVHQCVVYYGLQLEHMITDGQIVLQSKWWQNDAITYGEGKSQFIVLCNQNSKEKKKTKKCCEKSFQNRMKLR